MGLIKRQKYLDLINQALINVPIIVLIGARQVGKTSLMKSHITTLDKPYIFLNGQDPDVGNIFVRLSSITDYLRINLDRNLSGIMYLDEFQFIPNISTMLKLLADTCPDLKVICSGSSSINILQKVDESLAGRLRVIEVISLSLSEYIMFDDSNYLDLYNKYNIDTDYRIIDKQLINYLNRYLVFGGLPKVILEGNRDEKINLIDDIYQTYLIKDVRSFLKNEDVVAFNNLLKIISAEIGSLINPNSLSVALGISYRKCEEYLDLLEQMYIIKLVSPYVTNKRKEITKMKKLYFLDLGLRNMINSNFNDITNRADRGHILENYVYLELLKSIPKHSKIFYYRTADGAEIDFIIEGVDGLIPIEVKYQQFTKMKVFQAMTNFMELNNLKKGYVINNNMNDTITSDNIQLRYIPSVLVSKLYSEIISK